MRHLRRPSRPVVRYLLLVLPAVLVLTALFLLSCGAAVVGALAAWVLVELERRERRSGVVVAELRERIRVTEDLLIEQVRLNMEGRRG